MTSASAAMKPPHDASDFENTCPSARQRDLRPRAAHRSRRRARQARQRHAPRRPLAVRRSARTGRRSRAKARCRPPSRRRRRRRRGCRRRVRCRLAQSLFELVGAVVGERAKLRPRLDRPVEQRCVVALIDDDRLPGANERPDRCEVGLVAGREDDRGFGAHPVASSCSSSRWSAVVPLRKRDPVSPVP